MKTYRGKRANSGCRVLVNTRRLPMRLDLWNHSPSGYEWGYGGSGPAQLALAILADFLGDDDLAVQLHQAFKREVVCLLPKEAWMLTEENVATWLHNSAAAQRLVQRDLFDAGDLPPEVLHGVHTPPAAPEGADQAGADQAGAGEDGP